MNCRNCDYIKEEFERKSLDSKDPLNLDAHEVSCWCDKTGGKISWWGVCVDATKTFTFKKVIQNRKKRNKIERDLRHKRRLKFLAKYAHCYPCPVIYTDRVWHNEQGYKENSKPYYKRMYRGNHKGNRYKYYKMVANRKVRRYKEIIPKGGHYKRCFDYWWTVD